MKKLTITKIDIEKYDEESLKKIFSPLKETFISECNWPETFPYKPEVSFKAFHNGKKLFLQFNVIEKDIHSIITENFGKVWTDPCVEIFIAPDETTYYNFECTCIGRMLVACHMKNKETENMPIEALSTIERYPALGKENFSLRKGENTWSIIEVIPTNSLFKHNIKSWDGKIMRANFYKCGDNLPNPHFLSWNKIQSPNPNFHLPDFFGEIIFSKE